MGLGGMISILFSDGGGGALPQAPLSYGLASRLLKAQQNEPCLLFCLFELLFKNLKCACVNQYFGIDFKSAHVQTIICTSYLQLMYYSHQLFVGKLANHR